MDPAAFFEFTFCFYTIWIVYQNAYSLYTYCVYDTSVLFINIYVLLLLLRISLLPEASCPSKSRLIASVSSRKASLTTIFPTILFCTPLSFSLDYALSSKQMTVLLSCFRNGLNRPLTLLFSIRKASDKLYFIIPQTFNWHIATVLNSTH